MQKIMIRFSMVLVTLSLISCSPKPNAANQSEAIQEQTSLESSNEPVSENAEASFPGFNTAGKDTVTSPSGLKMIILEPGEGEKPKAGAEVSVHYTGYLTDGSKFDSSVDKGQPLNFRVGTGMVIRGWDEGISKLSKGGKARLVVPAELGYGEQGYPGVIPPMATLIFDVELVDILN